MPQADIGSFRKEAGEVTVQAVIDPLTFIGQDQVVYRLAGIDLPGLYAAQMPAYIGAATDALRGKIQGKVLKVYSSKTADLRSNRLNQKLVHAISRTDNIWVQGWLLAQGYARAFPTDMAPEAAGSMYALETKAREAGKGLWSVPENAVLDAGHAQTAIGSVGIISGRIHTITQMQTMLYLNFGTDWKKDFTIGLSSRMRQLLAKQGVDPRQWSGRDIVVRGFIESYYGPFINLTTPAQLALVAEGEKPTAPAKPPDAQLNENNTGLNQYIVTEKNGPAAPAAKPVANKEQGDDNAPQP